MTDLSVDRPARGADLADWLLSRGRHWVTTTEAAGLLGLEPDRVPALMARLRRANRVFSPVRGGYVPIPAEFRSWGCVPAEHFIDQMMRHLGHPYYVGLLSAAELHGAAHQRPQVFQVVTSARVANRSFGRVRLQFIVSAHIEQRPTVTRNTPTGTLRLATPEVTVLDIVEYPQHSGGLSNAATVIGELIDDGLIDIDRLAQAADGYPAATAQRTGWLIDHVTPLIDKGLDTDRLLSPASRRFTPTPLDARHPRRGPLDDRWRVIVNTTVESDL